MSNIVIYGFGSDSSVYAIPTYGFYNSGGPPPVSIFVTLSFNLNIKRNNIIDSNFIINRINEHIVRLD
jgi:hypothetical protein